MKTTKSKKTVKATKTIPKEVKAKTSTTINRTRSGTDIALINSLKRSLKLADKDLNTSRSLNQELVKENLKLNEQSHDQLVESSKLRTDIKDLKKRIFIYKRSLSAVCDQRNEALTHLSFSFAELELFKKQAKDNRINTDSPQEETRTFKGKLDTKTATALMNVLKTTIPNGTVTKSTDSMH